MARRKIDLSVPTVPTVVNVSTGAAVEASHIPLLCERIRFYREKSGMDQKSFAGRVGVTANAASNWERGRSRPDVNLLPAICRALNVTLYDLYGEAAPFDPLSERERKLIDCYRALSPENRYVADRTVEALGLAQAAGSRPKIRQLLYFERSLAAGFGDPTEFEQEAAPIYLYASPEVDRADYVFSVSGDSMEPDFHTGDLALVRKLSPASALRYGEIGAFIVGNETYIKEYREDGLHSLNRKYGVLHFSEDQAVYLIGRVLGTASPESLVSEEDLRTFLTIRGGIG